MTPQETISNCKSTNYYIETVVFQIILVRILDMVLQKK